MGVTVADLKKVANLMIVEPNDIKAGDIIAISGKAPTSLGIQLATLSVPNIGPLGRWGMAGISHVGIAARVFDEIIIYESTSFGRPACVRTGRDNPVGVQAHYLTTILDAGGDVFHYPLKRELYDHEEERLLFALEACLGRGYDYFGAGRAFGGWFRWTLRKMFADERLGSLFCSELVAYAWGQVGLLNSRSSETWNPARLCRHAVRAGITDKGRLIS